MTTEMGKDIGEKLALPAGNQQPPGSVTPSDMSFIDEKEPPDSEPGRESFEEQPKEDLERQQSKTQSLSLQRTMSGEYPKAFRLVTILVAVGLAVFLVALDMVSINMHPSQTYSPFPDDVLDNRSNGHSPHN